jgi:fumarylpyruvate hydrolase
MNSFLFEPLVPSLPVEGRDARMPVRRIFCVGRNYAAHAREMGKDPAKEPPFFFMKPADAVVESGSVVPYPPQTTNLHHEIELVVCMGRGGAGIEPERAHEHILGYAVGIDLTRRDLQLAARDQGRPWDFGKGFDMSAPCSAVRFAGGKVPREGRIWLSVNGALRQDADLGDMIFPIPDIIARISASMRLARGDLIFTGTPEGVGPLVAGDLVRGAVDGLGEIEIRIGERACGWA